MCVRQIRVLLLAGQHLISLEATGGLRKEVWRSDDLDGNGSITNALPRLEGLPPSIETTPHGNLSLRGDDLELSYPAFWEHCTRPPTKPMMP